NDDVDNCPDTPEGTTVDASGCADSQKDTDGDGVNDDIDNCPDTPDGATVDTNGCEIILFAEKVTFVENIYPNPTNDKLTVIVKPGLEIKDLYFVDFSGKTIKPKSLSRSRDNIDINVSNLNEGIYILEIVSDKEVDKVKIVIERNK
ncbi:MAG: T9SS type A sorting domain-containing protein, partial [Flammeovirgaceae bacterium]